MGTVKSLSTLGLAGMDRGATSVSGRCGSRPTDGRSSREQHLDRYTSTTSIRNAQSSVFQPTTRTSTLFALPTLHLPTFLSPDQTCKLWDLRMMYSDEQF